MAFTNPDVADFKAYFTRDFPYGLDVDENIIDSDIQRAMDLVSCQINQELFCSQEEYTTGFLLLSAHYLVMNIRQSSQGINGSFDWLISSKSVGSVSIGQSIPTSISENPMYSYYTKTGYGAQYIMLIYPRLAGNISVVFGKTQA